MSLADHYAAENIVGCPLLSVDMLALYIETMVEKVKFPVILLNKMY